MSKEETHSTNRCLPMKTLRRGFVRMVRIIIMSPEDIEKMNSTDGMIFANTRYGASINLVTGEATVFPWCICNKCRFNPSKSRLAWCSDYPRVERYCWKFREKEEREANCET